jgi:uncharacterized protein YciW
MTLLAAVHCGNRLEQVIDLAASSWTLTSFCEKLGVTNAIYEKTFLARTTNTQHQCFVAQNRCTVVTTFFLCQSMRSQCKSTKLIFLFFLFQKIVCLHVCNRNDWN